MKIKIGCLRFGIIVIIVAIVIVIMNGKTITGWIAESVYPDLAQPYETEAPATFTSYLPSAATEAVLGGEGAGLNCSIHRFAERIAFNHDKDSANISLKFRQACVMHDLCYRHGYATYSYTQTDCDTQLQQSAYRLCRQIQGTSETYGACEQEAKKVLLGVTLGGAGSFHDAKSSTYFEYDPMPARADDYIVGRAVPVARMTKDLQDFGVRIFYFKRHTVEMKVLGKTSFSAGFSSSGKIPFPGVLVATPPVLTGIMELNSDIPLPALVSLARDSFSNTRVQLIPFDIQPLSAPDKQGYSLALSPCPDKPDNICDNKNTDASITKFAIVEGKPVLLSLTHRGILIQDDSGMGASAKIVQIELLKTEARKDDTMTDYVLNSPNVRVNNQYRFIAHDMLIERDISGEAKYAWAFARGVRVATTGQTFITDNQGKDYKTHVAIARQKLGNYHTGDIQRFTLNAKETDEPLSLVRLDKKGAIALVGLAWSEKDLKRVENKEKVKNPPYLNVWPFPLNGGVPDPEPIPYSLPLLSKDGFIDIPPIIARISTQDAPLLIMTHVGENRWLEKEPSRLSSGDKTYDNLLIEFYIGTLSGDKNKKIGLNEIRMQCKINLDEQLDSPEAKILKERAYLIKYGKYSPELERDYNPHEMDTIKSDLAQRWHMSQIIVSEMKIIDTDNPVLAVTGIFHGFPAMSFQMLLEKKGNTFHYIETKSNPSFFKGCYSIPVEVSHDIRSNKA